MTGQKTLIGRILDGFAGDVWFQFIYVAIALRLTPWFASIGGWPCVVAGWLFGAYAGYWCHVRQANLAESLQNDPVPQCLMAFSQSAPVEGDGRIRFCVRL